jgi:hypothetical protein
MRGKTSPETSWSFGLQYHRLRWRGRYGLACLEFKAARSSRSILICDFAVADPVTSSFAGYVTNHDDMGRRMGVNREPPDKPFTRLRHAFACG